MWDIIATVLAQLVVVVYALQNPSRPPEGPSGPVLRSEVVPLVIGAHWPFTDGQTSLLYLHGQSTAFARDGLLANARIDNTLKINLVAGSTAQMVPVGTGFFYATGSGTISYGYTTGHVTKTLSAKPVVINLAQLVTTITFRPSGPNSRVETWSAEEESYGPGTYAVQAFVRGDSGFTLNINGLNDAFRVNFLQNEVIRFIVVPNSLIPPQYNSNTILCNVDTFDESLGPVLYPPAEFFDGNLARVGININNGATTAAMAYNGQLWVGILNGSSEGSGIGYSYDNGKTWFRSNYPIVPGVYSPFTSRGSGTDIQFMQTGIKAAWNGSYWLAIGRYQGPLGEGTIVRSDDGITWTSISESLGFRVAAVDLAWNGSIWLITGSDFKSGEERRHNLLFYDGNELQVFTDTGIAANYNGLSVIWDGDTWILMGFSSNDFTQIYYRGPTNPGIPRDLIFVTGLNVCLIYKFVNNIWTAVPNTVNTDPSIGGGTIAVRNVVSLKFGNHPSVKYLISLVGPENTEASSFLPGGARIYYGSTIESAVAKFEVLTVYLPQTNPDDIQRWALSRISDAYCFTFEDETKNYWLISGYIPGLISNYGRPGIVYKLPNNDNENNTLALDFGDYSLSFVYNIASSNVDDSLWTTPKFEENRLVRMPHGLQNPDSFVTNLQRGLGEVAEVRLESFYSDNPELIYIAKLKWEFPERLRDTRILFTDRFGEKLTSELAATYGLYNNGLIVDEYTAVAPVPNPDNVYVFDSPSPVYLSMPVTWTFRKPGIAGSQDTDGTFRIVRNSETLLTLGPGLHEFYPAENQVKLYGTFTGVGSFQFATLMAEIVIITSLNNDVYSNEIVEADIYILKSDRDNLREAVVPFSNASIDWITYSLSSEPWLTAIFTAPLIITDTGRDFTISFEANAENGDLLGVFSFRTTYYSAQKYTERISDLFSSTDPILRSPGVSFVTVGAGGGTFTTPNFQTFRGGSTNAVETDFIDLTTAGLFGLSVNVGYRGSQIYVNGSSGGRNTRVILNNVTIADSGGGGGASLSAEGGNSGLLGGNGSSQTPLPPTEENLHGKRTESGSALFGSTTSVQGKLYNLRPGGTGGFGSVLTEDGLVSDEVYPAGTGTQANTRRQFFGAGGGAEVAFISPPDEPTGLILNAEEKTELATTFCQTTNIVQETLTNNDAKSILVYALSRFAKNPIISTDAVIFGTNVAHLNVDLQSSESIVPSYLSMGPCDEFLPNTMSPNCRTFNDIRGSTNIQLNELTIYDDGQVIYDKVDEYIGTVFYAPGMATYVTSIRFGSSEFDGAPDNRYNCIFLTFTDDLSSSYGPFYWDIPGGFLNGNVITCDGLVGGLRAIVPLDGAPAVEPFLDSVYDAIYKLDITNANPVRPERQMPGTEDYARFIWPSNNLFCELFARPTNGPNSIKNGHYEEFDYTGQSVAFQVPVWCTTIKISAYGASGSSSGSQPGSSGSLVVATYRNLAGKTLTFEVGLAGGSPPGLFRGGLDFDQTITLGGGSTAVLFNSIVIQGAAGGGSGSSAKPGLSEFDTVWTSTDGRPGRSKLGNVGENSPQAGQAAGGSGFPGGSVIIGASGGISLVPPNGSLMRGYAGSTGLAESGKIIVEVY